MGDLFPSYKEEYTEIINDVTEKLQKVSTSLVGTKRQATLMEIRKILYRDAEDVMKVMKISARSAGNVEYKEIIMVYEENLNKLKVELDRTIEAANADDLRQLLPVKDEIEIDLTPHPSIVKAQLKMRESTTILAHTERMGEDTIHSGSRTLEELDRQREIMLHSKDTLDSLNNRLTKARDVMNDIWGKMNVTSLLKGLIILTLIVACFCVIYFRFIWNPKGSSSPSEFFAFPAGPSPTAPTPSWWEPTSSSTTGTPSRSSPTAAPAPASLK